MSRRFAGLVTIALCAIPITTTIAQDLELLTQPVYGGRINWIESVAMGSMASSTAAYNSYTFISTESPNSVFYTSIDFNAENPTPAPFASVPDLDATGNFGSIGQFTVHPESKTVYSAIHRDCGALDCPRTPLLKSRRV